MTGKGRGGAGDVETRAWWECRPVLLLLSGFMVGPGCEPAGPPETAVTVETAGEQGRQATVGNEPESLPEKASAGPAVSRIGKAQRPTVEMLRRDGWTIQTNGFEEAVLVSLEDRRMGSESARRLTGLKTLETIRLWNCADADDQFVVALAGLPRLKVVALRGAKVSDASWDTLAQFEMLESLNLGDNPGITGRGLAPLVSAGRLKRLYLDGTRVSDESLLELTGESSLEVLILNRTPITDAVIPSLKRMKSLKSLFVVKTGLSPPGLKDLAGTLERCVIVPDPATPPTPAPR